MDSMEQHCQQLLVVLQLMKAQAADEGEIGASSFESGSDGSNDGGRPSGSDSDSRFVCINNNNNIVFEGEEEQSHRHHQNYQNHQNHLH